MKEWDAVRTTMKDARRTWLEDGFVHTPEELKPLARAVLDALDRDETPPKDVELQGALYALVAPPIHHEDHPRFELVSMFHVALGDVAFALEVVAEATRYEHATASWIGEYVKDFAWIQPRHEQ